MRTKQATPITGLAVRNQVLVNDRIFYGLQPKWFSSVINHPKTNCFGRIKKWLMPESSLDTLKHGDPDFTVRFTEDVTGAEADTN